MSEYEQVIDEIVKHGVTVKVNKIVDDNYIPYERKYVGCVVELDFSEHDKAFEDKIAELKKDYKTASELLGKYQRENESLKKRIQELDTIDTIRIDENRELKQRISGLEKELEEWKEEARAVKKNRDVQLKSFRKAVEPYVDIGHMHETIGELKQRIAVLESKEAETPSDIDTSNPLACAESLIEHMTHCEKFMIMPERDVQTFSVEELKEIADYLMVYYKHHKYRDEEDTISF